MGTTLELPPGVLGAAMGFFPKLWAEGLFIEPNESRRENHTSLQSRAATNDYFDNRLVGRLFFNLII